MLKFSIPDDQRPELKTFMEELMTEGVDLSRPVFTPAKLVPDPESGEIRKLELSRYAVIKPNQEGRPSLIEEGTAYATFDLSGNKPSVTLSAGVVTQEDLDPDGLEGLFDNVLTGEGLELVYTARNRKVIELRSSHGRIGLQYADSQVSPPKKDKQSPREVPRIEIDVVSGSDGATIPTLPEAVPIVQVGDIPADRKNIHGEEGIVDESPKKETGALPEKTQVASYQKYCTVDELTGLLGMRRTQLLSAMRRAHIELTGERLPLEEVVFHLNKPKFREYMGRTDPGVLSRIDAWIVERGSAVPRAEKPEPEPTEAEKDPPTSESQDPNYVPLSAFAGGRPEEEVGPTLEAMGLKITPGGVSKKELEDVAVLRLERSVGEGLLRTAGYTRREIDDVFEILAAPSEPAAEVKAPPAHPEKVPAVKTRLIMLEVIFSFILIN